MWCVTRRLRVVRVGAIVVVKEVADRCVRFTGDQLYIISPRRGARACRHPSRHVVQPEQLHPLNTTAAASPSRHHRATWSRLRGHPSHTHHPHLGTYIIQQMIFIFCLDGKLQQQEICRFATFAGSARRRRHIIVLRNTRTPCTVYTYACTNVNVYV